MRRRRDSVSGRRADEASDPGRDRRRPERGRHLGSGSHAPEGSTLGASNPSRGPSRAHGVPSRAAPSPAARPVAVTAITTRIPPPHDVVPRPAVRQARTHLGRSGPPLDAPQHRLRRDHRRRAPAPDRRLRRLVVRRQPGARRLGQRHRRSPRTSTTARSRSTTSGSTTRSAGSGRCSPPAGSGADDAQARSAALDQRNQQASADRARAADRRPDHGAARRRSRA